jgi:hypothetical protein
LAMNGREFQVWVKSYRRQFVAPLVIRMFSVSLSNCQLYCHPEHCSFQAGGNFYS